jgi:membrane-bound ClpP family serine protease
MIEHLNNVLNGIPLTMIFTGCVMFGVAYTVIILAFGGHSGDGGGHGVLDNLLGGGGDSGGVDAGGGHSVHISFLSPLSLTTFMTAFGAFGLITNNALGWKPLAVIFGSGAGAALMNIVVSLVIFKVFIASQGSSLNTTAELIGVEAEVITAITPPHVGEIAYSTKQGRQTALARSYTGEPIDKGEIVVIVKFVGTAAQVKKAGSPDASAPQPSAPTNILNKPDDGK